MKLIFTDCENNLLKDTAIAFEYKKSIETISTDEKGVINLKGLPENVKITCFIDESDKHSIKFIEKSEKKIDLKLVKLDMIFVVLNKEKETLIGLPLIFEYNGKKEEIESDNTGQVTLKNIPLKTNVKVYQFFNGKEYNVEINKCVAEKAQYFFVGEHLFETNDMKFKLIDEQKQIIDNADVRFKYDNNEFESKTNAEGYIILKKIKIGTKIFCKQLIFGKSFEWQEVTCIKNKEEYTIKGEQTPVSVEEDKNSNSIVRMKFKLINSDSKPIANAILRLEYDGKVRNKYSNQNGEAFIDDIRIGSKINALVDIRGKKTEENYICNDDNELHEIKIETSNKKTILAFFATVALIVILIFFTKIDFSTNNKSEIENNIEQIVEDTIIKNYKYSVKDEITGENINYPKISLIYDDTVFTKKIDDSNFANFKAIENKIPKEVVILAIGYLPYKKTFILDSINEISLNKDTLINVNDKIENCGLFIKSEFNGTTIRNFKLNNNKGKFKLFYNMFAQPDKIEIYKGNVYNISKENLIYSSNIKVIGKKTTYVDYETTDSIVSIKISGINNNKGWIYKVFCPIKAISQNNN